MPRLFMAAAAVPLLAFSSTSAFAAATASLFAPPILFSPQPYLIAALVMVGLLGFLFHRRALFGVGALVLVALLVTSLGLDIAFAADAATPETVAQATNETTKVTWAYGAAISQWATAIGTIILAGVTWLLRLLPGQIYQILLTLRADQLLGKAIDYGINMVKGATKDRELTIDVHNEVLAKALQYVLDNAPGWLQQWMGGPEQIAKKIIARLKLAPDAVPDVEAAISNTTPAV
jgi:hypothetical protein